MHGGEHIGRVLNDHLQTYAAAAQPATITWHHSNTPTVQGHCSAKAIHKLSVSM